MGSEHYPFGEEHAYGAVRKPETPIKALLSNYFGSAENEAKAEHYKTIKDVNRKEAYALKHLPRKDTHATAIYKDFVKSSADMRVASGSVRDPKLFKMRKFLLVAPRIKTNIPQQQPDYRRW